MSGIPKEREHHSRKSVKDPLIDDEKNNVCIVEYCVKRVSG